MRKLSRTSERTHGPGEKPAYPDLEVTFAPRLIEEGQRELLGAVGNDYFRQLAAPGRHRPRRHTHYLPYDRDGIPFARITHGHPGTAPGVAPRVVGDKVAHCVESQTLGTGLGGRRPEEIGQWHAPVLGP